MEDFENINYNTEERKMLKCRFCGKEYKSQSGRWAHEKKHKQNELPNVNMSFQQEESNKQQTQETFARLAPLASPRECWRESPDSRMTYEMKPSDNSDNQIINVELQQFNTSENKQKHEMITLDGLEMCIFDPQEIIDRFEQKNKEPFSMLCYGMKESGKTTSIISILQKIQKQLDKIYVFTVALDNKQRYMKELNVSDRDCFGGFDDKVTEKFIQKLMKYQELTGKKKNVLLLFDDIVDASNKLHNSGLLDMLFVNHRRYNISLIVSTQQPKKISPTLRQNCNYSFVHYTKNQDVKDIVYNDYLSCIKKKEFESLFEKTTNNHNILVIEPLKHDDYLFVYNSRGTYI